MLLMVRSLLIRIRRQCLRVGPVWPPSLPRSESEAEGRSVDHRGPELLGEVLGSRYRGAGEPVREHAIHTCDPATLAAAGARRAEPRAGPEVLADGVGLDDDFFHDFSPLRAPGAASGRVAWSDRKSVV